MKTFLIAALVAASFNAWSNPQKKNANFPEHVKSFMQPKPESAAMDAVVTGYLNLKNALTSDDAQNAAKAGTQLHAALVALGKSTMSKAQMTVYDDHAKDAMEDAQSISKNGGNIKEQRDDFDDLSEDIYALVKGFGASQTLYKDYCPMADAYWLSEEKDIKNPYYGKGMLGCGNVKETIVNQ